MLIVKKKQHLLLIKAFSNLESCHFGVTNAPAVFQRLMQRVLAELQSKATVKFVSVYLDDVIVFSESFVEHIKHLQMVFDCLKKAGLKLNPEKCRILCSKVEYLGHKVTLESY